MPNLESYASQLADQLIADLRSEELSSLDLAAVRRMARRLIKGIDESFYLGPVRRREYERIVDLAIAEGDRADPAQRDQPQALNAQIRRENLAADF